MAERAAILEDPPPMTRRQSVQRALAGLTAATMNSADLKQKTSRPAPGSRRGDNGFRQGRRMGGVSPAIIRLTTHPSPATAALCLRVAQSHAFTALPARSNFPLSALAAVRPMSADAGRLFLPTGRCR